MQSIPLPKTWIPKNPEVKFPTLKSETALDDTAWEELNFPYFALPSSVETHVDTLEWSKELSKVRNDGKNTVGVQLMSQVLDQLTQGVDSEVKAPGNSATFCRNYFAEPLLDMPRIGDSIVSEVKSGHMAGPFAIDELEDIKINSFL